MDDYARRSQAVKWYCPPHAGPPRIHRPWNTCGCTSAGTSSVSHVSSSPAAYKAADCNGAPGACEYATTEPQPVLRSVSVT